MADILIRNVSAEDLKLLGNQARRLGLSKSDFLRRLLRQEARRVATRVTREDLDRFSDAVPDLADDSFIKDAWS